MTIKATKYQHLMFFSCFCVYKIAEYVYLCDLVKRIYKKQIGINIRY